MEQQISELVKLLNEGVQVLPSSIKLVINQYVQQEVVYAIRNGLFSLVFLLLGILFIFIIHKNRKCFAQKNLEQQISNNNQQIYDDEDDYFSKNVLLGFISVSLFMLFICSAVNFTDNVAHIEAPVYYLIQTLK